MERLIYLLRHGDVDTGNPRRFLGRTDLPLNDLGRARAAALGRHLQTVSFAGVYSSPLGRAVETACLVSGRRQEELRIVSALAEIDLGVWEGLSVEEIEQRFPAAYAERGRDLARFRPPGGENFIDLAERSLPALETISRSMNRGPLLIVAHGGVNRTLLSCLLNRPLAQVFDIPQPYCALNLLACTDEGLAVRAIDQPW